MEKIYFNDGSPTVGLSIQVRTFDGLSEDFTGKSVKLWLRGANDTVLVECSASNAGVVTAEVPTTLEVGVYKAKLKWYKYGEKYGADEVDDLFEVVSSADEATISGETYTIKCDTLSSFCLYEDLTDYEKAVLSGLTDKDEIEWLNDQSGAYVKPVDGIPSTDMTEAVQESLSRANNATVSTTVKTIVTLTQEEYDALAVKDANTEYNIIEV